MSNWQALIPLLQAGHTEALGQIVHQFQDMAVGYAYSMPHDFDLAEDAAQETSLCWST